MAEALPRLHAVTDDEILARPDFPARARAVLDRGGAGMALHLRGPHTDGRLLYDLAAALAPAARTSGARLLVNDRVDVALAAGTDGVQLGRRSLLPGDARRLLGDGPLVGLSVGSRAEVLDAAARGADFVLAGSVYATASHPGRAGIGPERIGELALHGMPVVAIGGVTPDRVGELRAAGVYGVAAIRAVWGADDPAEAVSRFMEGFKDADD